MTIAYHATNAPAFSKFDESKIGSTTDEGLLGAGFYFSTDAEGIGRGYKNTIVARLKTNKTLRLKYPTWQTNKTKLINEAIGTEGLKGAALTKELRARGYDSVELDYSPVGYHHKEIAVFNSKQARVLGTTKHITRLPRGGDQNAAIHAWYDDTEDERKQHARLDYRNSTRLSGRSKVFPLSR